MRDDTLDFIVDLLDNLKQNKQYDTISEIIYSIYDMIKQMPVLEDRQDLSLTFLTHTLYIKHKVRNRGLLLGLLPQELTVGLE